MVLEITHDTVKKYREALLRQKVANENLFMPWDASAKPFKKQEAFLRDPALSKLARCGNRSAKTFTTMRDLAWRLTYKHWYHDALKKTDKEYMEEGGRVFWVVGPTFDFLRDVAWEMYLKRFIPEWYYTDDDFVSGIVFRKDKGKEIIDSITFRNGDQLIFKTYAQDLKTQMGKAVHGVYIDEMPNSVTLLVELVTRTLDNNGCFILGFTPVVENEEIKEYVDNHRSLSVHQWGLIDNPLYRDDPDKLQRALDEWSHLPEQMKAMRLSGEWYYELKGSMVFANVYPEIVDDFEVPIEWRRVRVADPASHRTGCAFFAEDPDTGVWYCIDAVEIEWRGVLAKTDDIEKEINKRAPFPDFRYHLSIYDNAEAWFGAHAEGKQGKWTPCLLKQKENLILLTRDCIVTQRVKFFKRGSAPLVKQLFGYQRREDGSIVKAKDHMVDCLQYFCKQMPRYNPHRVEVKPTTSEEIAAHHYKKLQEKWKSNSQPTVQKFVSNRKQSVINVQRRGLR